MQFSIRSLLGMVALAAAFFAELSATPELVLSATPAICIGPLILAYIWERGAGKRLARRPPGEESAAAERHASDLVWSLAMCVALAQLVVAGLVGS